MARAKSQAMKILSARITADVPYGSQGVVAELAGLTRETISRWKKGQGNPRLSELEAFADALGVSVVYLIDAGRVETPVLPPTPTDARRIERLLREGERVQNELEPLLDAARNRPRQ